MSRPKSLEPKDRKIDVRFSRKDKERIHEHAKIHNLSVSKLVTVLVMRSLNATL